MCDCERLKEQLRLSVIDAATTEAELNAAVDRGRTLEKLLLDQIKTGRIKRQFTKNNQFLYVPNGVFNRRLDWDGDDDSIVQIVLDHSKGKA